MGLDLYLYTAKKIDDYDSEKELAYGRKTWGIASFFMNRCNGHNKCLYEVPEEIWDEFMEKITPYFCNKDFRNLIDNYSPYTTEAVNWQLEDLIEYFLDQVLDDGPYTLGAPWEAKALLRWYEADEEVRKIYKEDKPVFLCASY